MTVDKMTRQIAVEIMSVDGTAMDNMSFDEMTVDEMARGPNHCSGFNK